MSMIESLESRTLLSVALDPIAATALPGGKSVFVPVTGTTDSSTRVNYSVSSNNAAISARALEDISFLRMNISIDGVDKGYLEFALFDELAPNTVSHITNLVNSGFYTNRTFHRVIPGFMAQGGAGGQVSNVNDEFHPDALFTTPGLLAMANANFADLSQSQIVNDTNSSQFFVTVDETRWLDFRHTIFGQLIRGQDVLDQIIAKGSSSGTPSGDIRITSASMVENRVDTVVLVKSSTEGTANLTVTASDHNSTATGTLAAFTYADTQNTPAYLNGVGNQQTTSDLGVTFPVGTTDIDGPSSQVTNAVMAAPFNASQLQVTATGNSVTVTPISGFTGTSEVLVYVLQGYDFSGKPQFDSQRISVTVLATPFATYDAETRRLNVMGTSGSDSLQFAQSGNTLTVTMNGKSSEFGASDVESVNVMLYDGNDAMEARGMTMPLAVQAGAGNDTVMSGEGNDTIYGNEGDDSIFGYGGLDTIYGNFGNDVIGGGLKRDSIMGGIGNDTITAGDGPDTVYGGDGEDLLRGGKGADYIEGKGKTDSIYGGGQNDTILGQAGSDLIFGEGDDDTIIVDDPQPLVHRDTVYGGEGYDSARWDAIDSIFEVENNLLA